MNLTEQKIEEKIKEILDNSDTEIFVLGCAGMADFAIKMKEKYNEYNLQRITDSLVEIDNSGNISDSITAICLADNTTDIYELNNNNRDNNRDNNNNIDNSNNSNNRVVPLIPLDNIIIQE